MPTRLFTLAAAVSLILCVPLIGLQIRATNHVDVVRREDRSGNTLDGWVITSVQGWFTIERTHYSVNDVLTVLVSPESERGRWIYGPWPLVEMAYSMPTGWVFWRAGRTSNLWRVKIRLLPLILATALLPACWCWRRVQHHRRRQSLSLCPHCGYDLRVQLLQPPARCPECGTPAPPAATS